MAANCPKRARFPEEFKQPALELLLQAECKVFMMASEHRTNVGIAELLLVSVQTIENYRAHICIKLGLSSSHALSHFIAHQNYED